MKKSNGHKFIQLMILLCLNIVSLIHSGLIIQFLFFFGRSSNPKLYIYYALFISFEINSRGRINPTIWPQQIFAQKIRKPQRALKMWRCLRTLLYFVYHITFKQLKLFFFQVAQRLKITSNFNIYILRSIPIELCSRDQLKHILLQW